MNTIETLVFTRDSEPDAKLIASILKVAAKGMIFGEMESSLKLKPVHKGLLIQIMYRDYQDMVLKELDATFKVNNSRELALTLIHCVQDQCFSNEANKNVATQVGFALIVCKNLIRTAHLYEEIFSTNKNLIYKSSHIVFLARLKYCIKVLASVTHCSEAVASVEKKPFDNFLDSMRQLISPSLEHYKSDLIFNFLIKELIRKYSNSSIKFIMSDDNLKWIVPKDFVGEDLVT
jgi:hypothetical protein